MYNVDKYRSEQDDYSKDRQTKSNQSYVSRRNRVGEIGIVIGVVKHKPNLFVYLDNFLSRGTIVVMSFYHVLFCPFIHHLKDREQMFASVGKRIFDSGRYFRIDYAGDYPIGFQLF